VSGKDVPIDRAGDQWEVLVKIGTSDDIIDIKGGYMDFGRFVRKLKSLKYNDLFDSSDGLEAQ
jgi:hypothetical protein